MNKYLVELTETAQSDIKGIISYISRELKNPLAAKFRKSILNLDEMPKSHNLVKQ